MSKSKQEKSKSEKPASKPQASGQQENSQNENSTSKPQQQNASASKSPSSTKGKKAKFSPNPAERARVRAYCYLEMLSYKSAVKPARQAVARCADNACGEVLLALALRGIGKNHEALIHAEKAHELAPNDAEYSFSLGLCMWFCQSDSRALEVMEEALERLPQRYDMMLDMAGFLLQLRRFEEAQRYLDKAKPALPDHPKALELSKCIKDQAWSEKFNELATFPPLPMPNNLDTFFTIANTHFSKQRYELTLNKCSRVLDQNEQHDDAKRLYATAFYLKDHPVGAFCHEISLRFSKPRYIFIGLVLPILLGGYGVWHFIQANVLPLVATCLIVLSVYLLACLILVAIGRKRRTVAKFDAIIKDNHFTPQGRVAQALPQLDVLGQVIDNSAQKHIIPLDSHNSIAEIINQRQRTCNRWRAISSVYVALTVFSLFLLIAGIILANRHEFIGNSYVMWLKRIASGAVVLFAVMSVRLRLLASANDANQTGFTSTAKITASKP